MSNKDIPKNTASSSILRPWPLLESKILHMFSIFHLRQDTRQSPRTQKEHHFVVLDSPDWVNVVPVTPEGNIVLIRQFRHGTDSIVWEVPGGMVDKEDKDPAEAARRELLEETGYEPERVRFIGVVHPNPAILNNLCHSFVAEGCQPRQTQKLDGSEDIEVKEAPWEEVSRMIDCGEISHSLVLAAFFWYRRHLAQVSPPPLKKTME